MLAENKVIKPFHNILLIFRVIYVQRFDQLGLYQTLLVQPRLVF